MIVVDTNIAYDCEFIALAQYLYIPLITADKKFFVNSRR